MIKNSDIEMWEGVRRLVPTERTPVAICTMHALALPLYNVKVILNELIFLKICGTLRTVVVTRKI